MRTNPNSSRTVRHSMVARRPAVAALSQVKEFIITVLVSRISTRLCGRRRLLTVHGIESLQACRRQERPHTRTAEATVGTGPRAGRRLAVLASACGLRPWPRCFRRSPDTRHTNADGRGVLVLLAEEAVEAHVVGLRAPEGGLHGDAGSDQDGAEGLHVGFVCVRGGGPFFLWVASRGSFFFRLHGFASGYSGHCMVQ